jgi:hypothetical protein
MWEFRLTGADFLFLSFRPCSLALFRWQQLEFLKVFIKDVHIFIWL